MFHRIFAAFAGVALLAECDRGSSAGTTTISVTCTPAESARLDATSAERFGSSSVAPMAFVIGAAGAECSVTVLRGGGGGLAANVNRGRGRLGLEPLSEAQLQALPTRPLLGGAATLVDLDASPSSPRAGTALLGALGLVSQPGEAPAAVFVKLIGAKRAVEELRARVHSKELVH